MMLVKKVFTAIIFVLCVYPGYAQTVPVACGADRSVDYDGGIITVYVADGVQTRVAFPENIDKIPQSFNDEAVKTISLDWVYNELHIKPLTDAYGKPLFTKGNFFVRDIRGNSYPLYLANVNTLELPDKQPDVNVIINAKSSRSGRKKIDTVDILQAVFTDKGIPGMTRYTDSKGKVIKPDNDQAAKWFDQTKLELRVDTIYVIAKSGMTAFSADLTNKSDKEVVIPFDRLWWPDIEYSTLNPMVQTLAPGKSVKFYAWLAGETNDQLIPWLKEKE